MKRFILPLLIGIPVVAEARPKVVAPPPVVEAPPPPPVDALATMPTIGPAVAFVPPAPQVRALTNQVPVWVLPGDTLPIFSVVVTVPGGSLLDPAKKEGTSSLAMEAMRRGAGARTGPEFAAEVERLGLSISGDSGTEGSYFVLSGPRSQFEPGLDLLADLVLRPRLDTGEIKKERELMLGSLQQQLSEPGFVALRSANARFWGPTHPYGRPVAGTEASLKAVRPGDVRKWVKSAWTAAGAGFTVAGAVTPEDATRLLDARFGKWAAGKPISVVVAPAPAHQDEPIYIVDMPDSAQTGFYVNFPGLADSDPQIAPTQLGTIALGGTFTSRLNALLREKRGYTYGVRAGMDSLLHGGVLTVRTRIRTDATALALVDLVGELKSIGTGISAEELQKALGAARQDVVAELESQGGVAGTYAGHLGAGHAPDRVAAELAALESVKLDQVTAPMGAWNPAHAVFVLVGDRKIIEPALREKGFGNLEILPTL